MPAVLALFVIVLVFNGEGAVWTAIEEGGQTLAAALAAAACFFRWRIEHYRATFTETEDRSRPWMIFAAGMLAWTLAQFAWTISTAGFGHTPGTPSVLDLLFLSNSVLLVCALFTMVDTPAKGLSRVRAVLEGLLVMLGFIVVSWTVVLASAFAKGQGETFAGAINLFYPALDIVAVAVACFAAVQLREKAPPGLGLIAVGIGFAAVADSAFWYVNWMSPDNVLGDYAGACWGAGWLLVAAGAMHTQRKHALFERVSRNRATLAAPVIPGVIGSLVAVGSVLVGRTPEPLAVIALLVGASFLCTLALLLVEIYENHALTTNLEGRVDARTNELAATERYYRALVQHSSDVIIVIDATREVRFVSDSMTDVFGFPTEPLIGLQITALAGDASSEVATAVARAIARPGSTVRLDWDTPDRHGRWRHVESYITSMLEDADVNGVVINTRDVTERVELETQLRHQALHDELTGLANRALFNDRAGQALAHARRGDATVCVMLAGIDGFKSVNDSLGHETGDELLRQIGDRLLSAVRSEDSVARFGGDQFAVLISDLDAGEAETRAQELRDAVRPAFELAGSEYELTVSVGVVCAVEQTTVLELLRDADTAMYAAKKEGRDAVCAFRPEMHEQASERFQMQADLRRAIDRGEFKLFYQPLYSLPGRELSGFEALIRWFHPDRGMVPPDQFIPLAEETKMIVPMGCWIFDEALRQLAEWDSAHPETARTLTMSVNVSTVELASKDFVAQVRRTLDRRGIAPRRVTLEITEGSLLEDSELVIAAMNELERLGLRIAIDDFGTGYSSFSYLHRMPVTTLKIDRSFVMHLEEGDEGFDVLEAIVGIGRSLGLRTVAEGVEQEHQLERLTEFGCSLAQGFHLNRPVPAEEIPALLAADDDGEDERALRIA